MSILNELFHNMISTNALGVFVCLGVIGVLTGKLFNRLGMPEISGQVIAGLLVGEHVLGLFHHEQLLNVNSINMIALGIMTFIVGTHLNYKHLHNAGKRIFVLMFFDVSFTFLGAFLVLRYLVAQPITVALPCAAIAIATAPATIIHMIHSKKARGVLVKTLIGIVALNNVMAIIVFEVCKAFTMSELGGMSFLELLQQFNLSMVYLLDDVVIGFATGYMLAIITKHEHSVRELFTYTLLVILFNVGFCCVYSQLSYMLICLFAGIAFSNLSYHTKRVMDVFNHASGLLFAVFFTLAGTHLNPKVLHIAGWAGLAFIVVRCFAKIGSIYVGGRLFGYSKKIRNFLGMALLPQAGLAVGLVISLGSIDVFADILPGITAIILASVIANEIIGPFTTGKSFDLANESGQDTPRLVDFLQEEYILIPLDAKDKWDAINKMCKFMVKTYHLKHVSFEELQDSVMKREKDVSTGIGDGMAIPHAILPVKEKVMGVIGICRSGVEFESFDEKPVDIIILLATPKGKEELHLKIIAAVAQIFGKDREFHDRIVEAKTANEVYDLLQSKEIREINHFLDD